MIDQKCKRCRLIFKAKTKKETICPECESEGEYCNCIECKKNFWKDKDIQLCDRCMKKFDVENLWKLHDKNELDALDFNDNKKLREQFRIQKIKTRIKITEDSISIIQNGKEAVYWIEDEWIEDSSVVFSIANAIQLACKGKDIKKIIGKKLVKK
jgi:RecJ-like exonuclease